MTDKTVDSDIISTITQKEKDLTGKDAPVKGGPTAQAQKHAGEPITGQVVSDVMKGEAKVTGDPGPTAGGPGATVQSIKQSGNN
jgi:hypothetical protein